MFRSSFLKLKITSRLILVCLIMGLVPMTAAGIIEMSIMHNTMQAHLTKTLQATAEHQMQEIKESLDRVVKDVVFLAELPSLHRMRTGGIEWRRALEQEILKFNKLHPEYYQVRYLGLTGHEVLRSNYKNNKVFLTNKEDLQYKGHRYYFQQGILQKKGSVYFSSIDLNIEHSKVEIPPQLVVRISTPLYQDEVKRGIVVINLFANWFFEGIKLPNTPFTSLFVNSDGRILYAAKNGNPPPIEKLGGEGQHISTVLPLFNDQVLYSGKTAIMTLDSVIVSFNPVGAIGSFKVPAWYLITIFPKSYFDPAFTRLYLNLLLSAAVVALLGVILGVVMAKRFTRPIRQLFMEADLIAGGNLDHELHIKTGDEIEDLAEKFDGMRLQIKEKQQQLEVWNQELNEKLEWHISELRSLERQLYRADKLASLGEMSMRMAHEIGNPLASIKTVAQSISEDTSDNGSPPVHLGKIISEVNRLNAFLKNFNKFAVMKEIEPVQCDAKTLIRDVNFFLKIQALEQGVYIEEHFEKGIGNIFVDPQQVKQILVNLLLNAIQSSDSSGVIRVSLKSILSSCVCSVRDNCFCESQGVHPGAKEFVEISVCDNGAGIPEENLLRVFDPFFSTKTDGTGLGLSVVHRIVEKHRGIIRVFSKVGEGTTFRIYFPKDYTVCGLNKT